MTGDRTATATASAVERRMSMYRSLALRAGALVSLAGAAVLLGWALDIPLLKSIIPNTVTMKANTALAFLLAGLALIGLKEAPPFSRRVRRFARCCAFAVGAIGLLTLLEYATGVDFRIDQLLFHESATAIGTSSPGRMAPSSALNFLLFGLASLLLDIRTLRGGRVAEPLAILIACIGFTAFTGYLFGIRALTGFSQHTLMAVHTSFLFMATAGGLLLARPAGGWMTLVSDDGVAGLLVRWLVPGLAILMTLLGWLRLKCEEAGVVSTAVGTALFNVFRVVALAIVVLAVARLVRRLERRRSMSAADLRDMNLRLEQRVRERTAEITDARDELRAERDFVSTILEIVGALVVVLDRDGRIMHFNRMCEQTTGLTSAEVTGQPLWDALLLPEERDTVREVFLRLRAGDFPLNHENYWRTRDGGRRLIAWSNSCIAEPDGTVTHIIGTGIDITERRAADDEIRRLNSDLERRVRERTAQLEAAKSRLEVSNQDLEQFAYVASHDLQEPLRKISAFSDLLAKELGAGLKDESRDYLARMQAAVVRMHSLINDLLSLSRVTSRAKPPGTVDLNLVLRDVMDDLGPRIAESGARVEIGKLPAIEGDSMQMHQLLQNLVGNAIKFRRSDRPPEVKVFERIGSGMTEHGPGDFCELVVKDNGIGFEDKYAEQIFGIFRRLHARGTYEGTGIGLAVCRKIVQRHGGTIIAHGRPEEGAEFTVRLPFRQAAKTDGEGANI